MTRALIVIEGDLGIVLARVVQSLSAGAARAGTFWDAVDERSRPI